MSISTESLRQTLSGLLSHPVREAGPHDAVAGAQPRVVVEPATEDEVAAVVSLADRDGLKVLVRGGGTQLGLGSSPTGGDILLSTRRLDAVLEHEPHDQTIAVECGKPLSELQEYLRQTRQWLALDPPLPAAATIGGIVATNASGPRRLRFGAVRDQIIGIRVVLADGTAAKGGGKVVKNVAGYDLPKLFCGALGTLGVVVAANFRLYPLTAYRRTVTLDAATMEPLCDLALKITASTLTPTAIDLLGPEEGTPIYVLAVRFESGVEAAVQNQSSALLALAGDLSGKARVLEGEEENDFWRAGADGMTRPGADTGATLLKASLLPSKVCAWLGLLESVSTSAGLSAHWRAHLGHGIVYAWIDGDLERLPRLVEELRASAVSSSRGSLIVTQASPELLRRLDVWGSVSALDLMRRLKQRFDPNFTLNPGRFVGGI